MLSLRNIFVCTAVNERSHYKCYIGRTSPFMLEKGASDQIEMES